MKSIFKLGIVISIILGIISFNNKTIQKTKTAIEEYLRKGALISTEAQAALMAQVSKAIKKGGPEYAIGFCNIKVNFIIDSLNKSNNCRISRISERNRNPNNALETELDKGIWNYYSDGKDFSDTAIFNGDHKYFYYKPIRLINPACLKCHGRPQANISIRTLTKIDSLYPNDLAINYKLGDLRGLWKIEFVAESTPELH